METPQSVLRSVRQRDWMVTLDLKDAYLQISVHSDSRKFLRFVFNDKTFKFKVVCFSLSPAPQVFTRVMAPVSSIMHRQGFRILQYLDDRIVMGALFDDVVRVKDFLIHLCNNLGIRINLDKSSLLPAQSVTYLGMMIQSAPLRVLPTSERLVNFHAHLKTFFSSRTQPVEIWQSILGRCLLCLWLFWDHVSE